MPPNKDKILSTAPAPGGAAFSSTFTGSIAGAGGGTIAGAVTFPAVDRKLSPRLFRKPVPGEDCDIVTPALPDDGAATSRFAASGDGTTMACRTGVICELPGCGMVIGISAPSSRPGGAGHS